MKYLVHQFEDSLLLSRITVSENEIKDETWYTLIGTISKGAVWIKHGDILKEDEFKVKNCLP